MTIYILLVLFIMILGNQLQKYKNGQKIFCVSVAVILLLLMGFRSIEMGIYDVKDNYIPMYNLIKTYSFSQLINSIDHDYLFWIVAKLVSMIGFSGQGWLFLQALLYISSVSVLIYKKAKYPVISYILFLGLNYYGHAFTILRQAMALSFVIIAFLMYEDGKNIKSVIAWVIACGFHITALTFVLYFIIGKIKVGWKQWLAIAVGFLTSNYFATNVLIFIQQFFTADRFSRYFNTNVTNFNYTMLILALFIYILSYINKRKALEYDPGLRVFFNLSTLNIVALSFINMWDLLFRVAMYFGIFSIILFPNTLYYDGDRIRKLILGGSVILFYSIYFICFATENAGILPYRWCF